MTKILVASQMPEIVNREFASRAPAFDFCQIPEGRITTVPTGAKVLIPVPIHELAQCPDYPQPVGWPFDLRWMHAVSTGVDSYPDWMFHLSRASFSPGTSAISLAEYSLAAILAVAKHLPNLWIVSPDQWQRRTVDLIDGASLGIVGFGSIGEALATRAMALGMTVRCVRRSDKPMIPGVVRAQDVAEIFRMSDHVVLAASASEETCGMINAAVLTQAKPGLHLINVARGTLIDNAALLNALDSGQLSFATLDVTDPEPLPAGHPFYTHPRVRISPHTASITPRLIDDLAVMVAAEGERFIAGQEPFNPVVTGSAS